MSTHYGICRVSISPIRATAKDKSEMVTQLLFGETVEILEKQRNWLKVRCTWDNYIGWLDTKHITPLSEEAFLEIESQNAYSLELVHEAINDDYYIPLVLGSRLPAFDGLRFRLGVHDYRFSGQAISKEQMKTIPDMVVKIARRYLFAPYLWGGRSPFGIDCSGLVQMVFKLVGIPMLRDASQQVTQGRDIDFIEQAQIGDLAFFENNRGRITHVGIIFPEHRIIHAHGVVRIDKLDHYGIFNVEMDKYTHRLRVIRRFLDDIPSALDQSEEQESIHANQVSMFKD